MCIDFAVEERMRRVREKRSTRSGWPSREPVELTSGRAMRSPLTIFVLLVLAMPARGQYLGCVNLDRVDRRLAGQVVDYTNNHGADRRIFSPILGMPRDLYVYLPPGYDPRNAYPLVVYLHMAYVDEHYFVGSHFLTDLDDLILRGECPPVVVASPDGTYGGRNRFNERHSLYVNGLGGRVEDHLLQEVMPFLTANYAIRPERDAHALLGTSAGGYGAMSLAIRHRDTIGAVATLAAPLNLRYSNVDENYFEDFNPATYRWRTCYDSNEVVGVFYWGFQRIRAGKRIGPVFGDGDQVVEQIVNTNPADLLYTTDLRPGELAIYAGYAGRDEWNIDAQNESFAWLAAQKGIEMTLVKDPDATHNARYFRDNLPCALRWLGQHFAALGRSANAGQIKEFGNSDLLPTQPHWR